MSLGLTEVGGPDWIDRIGRFRVACWSARGRCAPDAFPDGRWVDALDREARHFVLVDGDALVGAIRLTVWPSIADSPHAEALAALGVRLDGRVALPERAVSTVGRGAAVLPALADHVLVVAAEAGARWVISEASPPTTVLLRARGRQVLGASAPDPRFPDVAFTWVLTDLTAL